MLVDVHIKTNFGVLHYGMHSEHCLLHKYGAPMVTWWWNKYDVSMFLCSLWKKIAFHEIVAFIRKTFVFFE